MACSGLSSAGLDGSEESVDTGELPFARAKYVFFPQQFFREKSLRGRLNWKLEFYHFAGRFTTGCWGNERMPNDRMTNRMNAQILGH